MIYETGLSLVDDERQTEKPRTEHQAVMSSRGEMQRPEMNDGQRLQDDMVESVAVMMTIEDGGDQGDRRREQTDLDGGARPCSIRNVITATLKSTRFGIRSQ